VAAPQQEFQWALPKSPPSGSMPMAPAPSPPVVCPFSWVRSSPHTDITAKEFRPATPQHPARGSEGRGSDVGATFSQMKMHGFAERVEHRFRAERNEKELADRRAKLVAITRADALKQEDIFRQTKERMQKQEQLETSLTKLICSHDDGAGLDTTCRIEGVRCTVAWLNDTSAELDEIVDRVDASLLANGALSADDAKVARVTLAQADEMLQQLQCELPVSQDALRESQALLDEQWHEFVEQSWKAGDELEAIARDYLNEQYKQVFKLLSKCAALDSELQSARQCLLRYEHAAEKQKERLEQLSKKVPKPVEGRRVVLRELEPDEEEEVAAALGPGLASDMLADFNGIPVKRHDMASLRPKEWLNDEVINFFIKLLEDRAKTDGGDRFPTCHFMNTQFYPKLAETDHGYNYASVRRWTKKIDVFAKELIIVPIHCHGNHWTLAVVNFKQRLFEYFDSLRGGPSSVLLHLRKYIEDESIDKKKVAYSLSDWSDVVHADSPTQRNGYDCGVFMCTTADYLSQRAMLDFTQDQMPLLRRRMVLQILRCALQDELQD